MELHDFRDIPIGGASRGQHMQAMYVEMRLVVVSRRLVLEFGSRNDDYHIFDNNVLPNILEDCFFLESESSTERLEASIFKHRCGDENVGLETAGRRV